MESQIKNKPKFRPNPELRLMDHVRGVLRYQHYAYRTEQTYCQWILRYLHYFGGQTHPKLLGAKDVERYLSEFRRQCTKPCISQKVLYPVRQIPHNETGAGTILNESAQG